MKVEVVDPVVDKDVVITMKMSELKELIMFFNRAPNMQIEAVCGKRCTTVVNSFKDLIMRVGV